MIRVLVADDHAVVRRGLRQILSDTKDIQVVAEAATAAGLMGAVQNIPLAVVVLAINLGAASGLELLAKIKKEKPALPVIILTVDSEDQYAVRAVKTGAAGFLTKETAPDRLIEAVRKVAS